MNNKSPQVVLLGLVDTGYGMVRSLVANKISVMAFEWHRNRNYPENKTSLCKIDYFLNEEDLLKKLLILCENIGHKPVLFLSSDPMVNFFSENRSKLIDHFLIHFPEKNVVNTLLEKTLFTKYAIKNKFLIPQTLIIGPETDINVSFSNISLPCIVKPYWRRKNWGNAHFPKVFLFRNENEIGSRLPYIFEVEKNLIIQEYIPGMDNEVHFCLTYFNNRHDCISHFTGRKLRQWPVGTGSTSCAEPFSNKFVKDETIRLLKGLSFAGFGSVEFKRDIRNGKFYIMEPTVGRPNHQSYLATAMGINMPCDAYSSLTGKEFHNIDKRSHPVMWVDDPIDLLSILVSLFRFRLSLIDFFRTLITRKSYRYINRRDLLPFVYFWIYAPIKLIRKIFRMLLSFSIPKNSHL